MPEHAGRGIYRGTVTVSDLSGASQEVNIAINLSDNVLVDKGDGDLWRLSRLRWLNSQYAVNNRPVKPFIPIKVADRTISVLGRSVTAGELDVRPFHSRYSPKR